MIQDIRSDRERLRAELQMQAQSRGRAATELASVELARAELAEYNRRGNMTLQELRSEVSAASEENARLQFELGLRDDELAQKALEQQCSDSVGVAFHGADEETTPVGIENIGELGLGSVPSFASLSCRNQAYDVDSLLRRATNQGGSVAGVFRGLGPSVPAPPNMYIQTQPSCLAAAASTAQTAGWN
eukprot:2321037-Amphidinium_carterae.1